MKTLLIIVGVILLAFITVQLFAWNGQRNIETYPYQVNKKYDTFEIRSYEASLFTSVQLTGNKYKDVSSKGFSILAGYIFGGNERNEKISMTSPVTMTLEDSMTMMFMVPKNYNLKNLPNPKNSKIVFEKEEEKIIAAIRFDGWADDEKIEKYKSILTDELIKEKLNYINKFTFLGYNPPYEVMNRRNEVVVELINYKL